jgi:hypothetical protein
MCGKTDCEYESSSGVIVPGRTWQASSPRAGLFHAPVALRGRADGEAPEQEGRIARRVEQEIR